MAREIKDTNQSTEKYTEKLLKLIPSEIIAAYLAIDGILSSQPDIQKQIIPWVCAFLLISIPFHLWFLFNVRKLFQIIVTMISFVVWIFSIGGPFLYHTWYLKIYGAVVLILWTLTVPLFNYKGNGS
jgi:hypothetical protein